uniref:rRNA-processing protein UTP23 n=1 Tax=Panagrolaimus sp. JU765 TaxID=591449 RepID=A0AC34QFH3_9BILA
MKWKFKVVYCPHKPARSARECILRLARRSKEPNKQKYIIATQDNQILEELREFGGVPLLSVKTKSVLLEKPSEASLGESADDIELARVKELKKEILGEDPDAKVIKRKKKKGVNPLSMLKSKKKIGTIQKNFDGEKKTRRRRKKKPFTVTGNDN